jgi:hypothetical protein
VATTRQRTEWFLLFATMMTNRIGRCVAVAAALLASLAACNGGSQQSDGSGVGGQGGGAGGQSGVGGQSGSPPDASTSGAAGVGGMAGDGGRGAAGQGGAAGATITPANCHSGLACAAGQACMLDCMGNTMGSIGLSGPGIICGCTNGAYSCRVMYEGTSGPGPGECAPSVQQGGACTPRCSLCRVPGGTGSDLCFCSKDLVWICN